MALLPGTTDPASGQCLAEMGEGLMRTHQALLSLHQPSLRGGSRKSELNSLPPAWESHTLSTSNSWHRPYRWNEGKGRGGRI